MRHDSRSERETSGCKLVCGGLICQETYSYNDTCVRTSRSTRESLKWLCMPTPKTVKKEINNFGGGTVNCKAISKNKIEVEFEKGNCIIWACEVFSVN